jgi:hypothetical protein
MRERHFLFWKKSLSSAGCARESISPWAFVCYPRIKAGRTSITFPDINFVCAFPVSKQQLVVVEAIWRFVGKVSQLLAGYLACLCERNWTPPTNNNRREREKKKTIKRRCNNITRKSISLFRLYACSISICRAFSHRFEPLHLFLGVSKSRRRSLLLEIKRINVYTR